MPKTSDRRQERAIARIHDYQATFSSPEGKRVLRDLMKLGGFLRTNHIHGDSHATAFYEGGRSIVIHIFEKLKIDVRKLEKQLSEVEDDDSEYGI